MRTEAAGAAALAALLHTQQKACQQLLPYGIIADRCSVSSDCISRAALEQEPPSISPDSTAIVCFVRNGRTSRCSSIISAGRVSGDQKSYRTAWSEAAGGRVRRLRAPASPQACFTHQRTLRSQHVGCHPSAERAAGSQASCRILQSPQQVGAGGCRQVCIRRRRRFRNPGVT